MLEVSISDTRRLDAIWLPQGVEWIEEYQNIPLSVETEYTTGGLGIIWQQQLTGLQSITLKFDQAWLNKAMVDNLKVLAKQIGANYELEWDGEIYNVIFVSSGFKPNFLEGFRKTKNVEDCPFVGEIKLTTLN